MFLGSLPDFVPVERHFVGNVVNLSGHFKTFPPSPRGCAEPRVLRVKQGLTYVGPGTYLCRSRDVPVSVHGRTCVGPGTYLCRSRDVPVSVDGGKAMQLVQR